MLLAFLTLATLQQATPGTGPTPYWQQFVAYEIDASLDEPSGVLSGRQQLVYRNNSPDTLHQISFHLYLNAFRPGSRWSDADSIENTRRFNDLKDPDYGFNHVSNVRIMGQRVEAIYPLAPDSTIVRFMLPRPLAPGDSLVADMDWDARPSTVPRRQGRRGRSFDFAQWYPRVVVYDQFGWEEHALYPAGEFYGEFGTYLVRLNVAEDQVIGATGVPVCGDPGWARANQVPGGHIDYQRDFYGDPTRFACPAAAPAAGRKLVTWYAADVHHFAMSLNPEYRYEGGRWGGVAVHVLYQPGDEKSWGGGVAVKRTEIALAWLNQTFGTFAWPQITNVHRIEGGGTEFPMMIMDGSASQGLIVHELGHNYVMGILANNEWREGWLDEGFTSYQEGLFTEANGGNSGIAGTEAFLLGMQLDGYAEPYSMVSNDYRDFFTYSMSIYSGGELFLRRLQYVVGDSTMQAVLRNYYAQWKLKHVNEDRFRAVAEETSQQPLGAFFAQQLHGVDLTDYAVGRTSRTQGSDGGWVTRVEVLRKAPRQIPVEVQVTGKTDTAVVRSGGVAEREWVVVHTRSEPTGVTLDPRVQTGDWNFLDNHKSFGLFANPGRTEPYLDTYFSTKRARDHMTLGIAPEAWYNDAGGVTLGLRSRSDYLGRYDQNTLSITGGTGWGADDPVTNIDVFARVKNPTALRSPNMSQVFEGYSMEGRAGATVILEKKRRAHRTFGPTVTRGLSLRWVSTTDTAFLDPGYYQNAGTGEATVYGGVSTRSGDWQLSVNGSLGGGVMYDNEGPGITTDDRYDTQGYFRGFLVATAKRAFDKTSLALRGYAGAALANDPVVKQRQIYLAGADPYEQLYNPFLRSEGALLVRPGVYYQAPGGANLRGFDPHTSSRQAYGLNAQVERTLVSRRGAKLFSTVSVSVWGDAALADPPSGSAAYGALRGFYDAGLGVSASHRIGQTSFVTRFDVPLFVSQAGLAQDTDPTGQVGFRWLFSFAPAF
ncbi:MAG: M1 family metallopeptidase [Gemmatimonadales bacterium]